MIVRLFGFFMPTVVSTPSDVVKSLENQRVIKSFYL